MNVNRELLEALKASEEKFHTIFDSSQEAIILSDFDGKIIEINPYFKKLLGFKFSNPDKPINIFDFIPPSFHTLITDRLSKLERGETLPLVEIPILTKDNKEIFFEIRRSAITYHKEKWVLTVARDITERNLFQKKMLEATIEIEERERRKLASDLHDDVGPLLSAINMHLSLLVRKEENLKHSDSIQEISMILMEAISRVREIANNLSPHILVNYGLKVALNAFFETKNKILPVKIEYHPANMSLPDKIQLALYRITEELYNNSLKHSGADQVSIIIELSEDNLIYIYTDNGIGFHVDGILKETSKGMGLINIFNRIKALNGSHKIQTAPGKGFLIEFTINNLQVL